ncbi:hypothetical protein BDY19DRAFT_943620 [Irpex rosettiformis]|uniref:Uncharacterized protein n=1 Tax=Irpex rosettiformis TaxID=378272 RepID=A0ACB8U5U8_9APHY|nr:hypothetical protein BDY19DRAFT_943620 [Irpex rosettiformis]
MISGCLCSHLPPPYSNHFCTSRMPKAPKNSKSSILRLEASPAAPSTGEEYRFDFGKHRGKTLGEVPWGYIEWCKRAGIPDERKDFSRALEQHRTKHSSAFRTTRAMSTEERLQAVKRKLPAWLYDACIEAFEDANCEEMMCLSHASEFRRFERDKVEALEEMSKLLAHSYPPRPSSSTTLPDSELVEDLRTVLSLLPESAWNIPKLVDRSPCADATNSVYVHHDGFTGTDSLLLTERCSEKIRYFLRRIEKEHGREVRVTAQWEVYDKVAKSIGGITYSNAYGDEKGFYDPAREWVAAQPNRLYRH